MKRIFLSFIIISCIICLLIFSGCTSIGMGQSVDGYTIVHNDAVDRILFYSNGQCTIDQIFMDGTTKTVTTTYKKKIMENRQDPLYQQMSTVYSEEYRSSLDSFLGHEYIEIDGDVKVWIIGAVNYYAYSSNLIGSNSRAYKITPSNYEIYVFGIDNGHMSRYERDVSFDGNILKITSQGKSQTSINDIAPKVYSFDTDTNTVIAVLQKESGNKDLKLAAILFNPRNKQVISSGETSAGYGVIELSE